MLDSKQINNVNRQSGFTLMEVMIASFVLAVGMLGSTAMMLRGQQEAEDTNYEAIAVQLAANMAERMRSNLTAVEKLRSYDALSTLSAARVDCSSSCTAAEIADYHNYIWSQEMKVLLPNTNPSGTVTAQNANVENSVYEIVVKWDRINRQDTETVKLNVDADGVHDNYHVLFQP